MSSAIRSSPIRRVSVVAPMRNEADHVETFVRDLADQRLDCELEIIVADGASTDGSADLLSSAARRAGLALNVVDNPNRSVSHGLNACIAESTGDLVVRLDCHTRYPDDYLIRCVEASESTGAWNVGGVVVPRGRTKMEKAVACAMNSPFGGIVWTRHAARPERVEVDTVPFGAFRREVFERIGLFDESLVRNQDDEFNLRLRLAGGRVVLDPTIQVNYVPRGSLRAVSRQYYEYGFWKVAVMRKHRQVLGARSLAPIGLVGSVTALALAAPFRRAAARLLGLELGAYASCVAVFAVRSAAAQQDRPSLVRVASVFPTFHLSYGIGMMHGWLRAAVARR